MNRNHRYLPHKEYPFVFDLRKEIMRRVQIESEVMSKQEKVEIPHFEAPKLPKRNSVLSNMVTRLLTI